MLLSERRRRAAEYIRTWRRLEYGGDLARRRRVLTEAARRIYRL